MKKLLIALIFWGQFAYGQIISTIEKDAKLSTKKTQILNSLIRNHRLLTLDPKKISSHVKSNPRGAKLRLPVSENLTLDLTIQPNEIRSSDYRAVFTTAQGVVADTTLTNCNTYSGYANNDPAQFVRLYIDNDQIKGIISDGKDGFYAIEPLADVLHGDADNRYVVFNTSDVNSEGESCGLHEPISEAVTKAQHNARTSGAVPANCSILEVATDADYEYYLNNRANSNARILNDMNIVAGIYLSTFNIRIVVTHQNVFTTKNDPYTSTDPSELLREEADYWNKNHTDIKRDVVHLFTGKILNGMVLGIGYKGTIGKYPSMAYSLTCNTTKEYGTVAHEIGHNLNASHPKDQASGCGTAKKTIMCSGLDKVLAFSEFSQGEINDYLASNEKALLATDYDFRILGDSSICASTTFRTNLMGPAVSWSSSNSGLMTIDPVTGEALRIGTDIGLVTVSALIDLCNTAVVVTKDIFVGLPSVSLTGEASDKGDVKVEMTDVPFGLYSWYLDGVLVGDGAKYMTTLDGGSCGDRHFIQATVTNACGTTPLSNKLSYSWECNDSGVNIYPNPARDVVSLDFDASSNKEIYAKQIFLYDGNSKKVLSVLNSGLSPTNSKTQLNVADFPRGTYYLHVVPSDGSDHKTNVKRIILQ